MTKEHSTPWRRTLEAKINAAWREISQLSQQQKGVMKKGPSGQHCNLSIPEAVEVYQATPLSSSYLSKEVNSRSRRNKQDVLHHIVQSVQSSNWTIWERKRHNSDNSPWLQDLWSEHSNFPEHYQSQRQTCKTECHERRAGLSLGLTRSTPTD